jgi:hypothetical protein
MGVPETASVAIPPGDWALYEAPPAHLSLESSFRRQFHRDSIESLNQAARVPRYVDLETNEVVEISEVVYGPAPLKPSEIERLVDISLAIDDKPLEPVGILEEYIPVWNERVAALETKTLAEGKEYTLPSELERFYFLVEQRLLQVSTELSTGSKARDWEWFDRRDIARIQDPERLERNRQAVELAMQSDILGVQPHDVVEPIPRPAKELQRLIEKWGENPEKWKYAHDYIGYRLVCRDLNVVGMVWKHILERYLDTSLFRQMPEDQVLSAQSYYPKIVRYKNFFEDVTRPHSPTYRAINVSVAARETHCSECQIMTRNQHLVCKLDHSFEVNRCNILTDSTLKNYLADLRWKVNIYDALAYLSQNDPVLSRGHDFLFSKIKCQPVTCSLTDYR